MKGQRSSAYPSYSISYCLNLCETIYKTYGTSHRASREELATTLNLSVGNIIMKISSCSQYGLLDMKSKEGYKVSELFVRYFRPIDEKQSIEAKIEAFKSPTLYQSLISSFSGGILPPVKPLSNILLQKHSISESACESAASIFIENAKELNLLTVDNEFNVDGFSEKNNIEIEEIETEAFNAKQSISNNQNDLSSNVIVQPVKTQEPNQAQNNFSNNGFVPSNGVVINILLKEKRTAQLVLPNDAMSGDLETIINWIRLMKESF